MFFAFLEIMLSTHLCELKLLILIILRRSKRVMKQVAFQHRFFYIFGKIYDFMNLSLPFPDVSVPDTLLNLLCLQVGLSFGTFSFDAHGGLKTATEVVSENSKTYKTIKNFQNQIVPAIRDLVDAIIEVAALYDMTWDGMSIAQLASRGYEVKVSLDDGVTQDRQTNINEGLTLVGAGLMSKYTFLTDPKYGINMTDDDAAAELQRIADEQTVTMPRLDIRDFNGIE